MFDIVGCLFLVLFIAIVVLLYHMHMSSVYKSISDEEIELAKKEAEQTAEAMFEDMKENAQIHVNWRMNVVCGKGMKYIMKDGD